MSQRKNEQATKAQLITFSRNLRHFLEESGMKQSSLAESLGVSGASVCDWARGKKYPRPGYIVQMAEIFDVPVSALREESAVDEELSYALGKIMADPDGFRRDLLLCILSLNTQQQHAIMTVAQAMKNGGNQK